MCGTPVVSFGIGVALDLVINGVTGYQAQNFSSQDFAFGLLKLLQLDFEETNKLSISCRNYAVENYSREVVAKKWNDLLLDKQNNI